MRRRPWLEVLLILLAVGLLTRLAEPPPEPGAVKIVFDIGDPPGIVMGSDGLHRLRLSPWMASQEPIVDSEMSRPQAATCLLLRTRQGRLVAP